MRLSFLAMSTFFVSTALASVVWGNPTETVVSMPDATSGTTTVVEVDVDCPGGVGSFSHTYNSSIDMIGNGIDLPEGIGDSCTLIFSFDAFDIDGETGGEAWTVRILDEVVSVSPSSNPVTLDYDIIAGSPPSAPELLVID